MIYPPESQQWISIDGIRTRYVEFGAGEPVIFLHGGHMGDTSGGECAEVWSTNLPALSKHYRCIAVDRLGQGLTDNPKQDSDYSMRGSVDHVIRFLETHGTGPYHLVGHSRAGYVVAQVTLQRRDLVRSCTIVCSNTAAPGPGRYEIVFASNTHPAFTRERALYSLTNYSFKPDHIEPEWLEFRLNILQSEKYRQASKKMMEEGLFESVFQPELRRSRERMFAKLEHESIGRPTMVFWSANDLTATIQQGEALYRLIAKHEFRSQMHVVNEAGHYSFRERPQIFNRSLTNFLEDCRYGA